MLTLTGTNSYSGTTTINAGTLQIGAYGSLGTGNVVDARPWCSPTECLRLTSTVRSQVPARFRWPTTTWSTSPAPNTFTGPVTVNGSGSVGSLLVLCNNSALGSTSGVTVNNNGGLALTSGITIAGASLVLNGGTALLVLGRRVAYAEP